MESQGDAFSGMRGNESILKAAMKGLYVHRGGIIQENRARNFLGSSAGKFMDFGERCQNVDVHATYSFFRTLES